MIKFAPRKISVIVPADNTRVVLSTLTSLSAELKATGYDYEIIIVDNTSSGNNLRQALRLQIPNDTQDKIKVFDTILNNGKNQALYHGFYKTSAEIIVFFESDLDLPAINVRKLLAYFDQENADIAIGSKTHPQSIVSFPLTRKLLTYFYLLLLRILFNINISDFSVGIKVFKREVLEKILVQLPDRNDISDLELLILSKRLGGVKICEGPIILNFQYSMLVNIKSIVYHLVNTFKIFYHLTSPKLSKDGKIKYSISQNLLISAKQLI